MDQSQYYFVQIGNKVFCSVNRKNLCLWPYLEMSVCDELLDDELQEEDDENPDEVEEAVDGGADE